MFFMFGLVLCNCCYIFVNFGKFVVFGLFGMVVY